MLNVHPPNGRKSRRNENPEIIARIVRPAGKRIVPQHFIRKLHIDLAIPNPDNPIQWPPVIRISDTRETTFASTKRTVESGAVSTVPRQRGQQRRRNPVLMICIRKIKDITFLFPTSDWCRLRSHSVSLTGYMTRRDRVAILQRRFPTLSVFMSA